MLEAVNASFRENQVRQLERPFTSFMEDAHALEDAFTASERDKLSCARSRLETIGNEGC